MMKRKKLIEKKDIIIITVMTLFYAIISFYQLGDLKVPQTYQEFPNSGYHVTISLKKEEVVNKIRYYTGYQLGKFIIMSSLDGKEYQEVDTIDTDSVFSWEEIKVNTTAKYIEFISKSSDSTLGDVQLYGEDDKKLDIIPDKTNPVLDELHLVPDEISYLNSTYFDEIYYARTAYEYTKGIDCYEWSHPPLGKLIMTIPVYLFGFSPFTYRFMGNLFGIFLIPIMYILAKKLTKEKKYAILGALLMMFDTFHFAHTRIAVIDSFQLVFILLSVLFMICYLDTKEKKYKYLILSGIFFGCSISTKWNAFYIGLGLGIIFLIHMIKDYQNKKETIKELLLVFLSFIIIPIVIYLLSYILFPTIMNYDRTILGIIDQTKRMFEYHNNLTASHPFSSKWYEWPLMIRPVWLYTSDTGTDIRRTIVDIGNPMIWWSGIFAFFYLIVETIKEKKKETLWLIIMILSSFLPYLWISRPMYLYHYFITLPFIMLGIVFAMKKITEITMDNKVYYAYIIFVIIFFILFYPVVSGLPVKEGYIDFLRWLPTWSF